MSFQSHFGGRPEVISIKMAASLYKNERKKQKKTIESTIRELTSGRFFVAFPLAHLHEICISGGARVKGGRRIFAYFIPNFFFFSFERAD